MATLIDGKKIAADVYHDIKKRVKDLRVNNKKVTLAIFQVGNDPASTIYVQNKRKTCEDLGIKSYVYKLSEDVTQEELVSRITVINEDVNVDGIMIQLPLPKHLDFNAAVAAISPEKDVDGLTTYNMGKLYLGNPEDHSYSIPCTAKGIMRIFDTYQISLQGKRAVIVGRSNIVGKPVSALLQQKNCTVTTCHSYTKDLQSYTKEADILVVAVGSPKIITGNMIKPGAVVIDVGINRIDGKVVGDVDFAAARQITSYITPVPGGVGPLTVAMLLENTVEAAERRL